MPASIRIFTLLGFLLLLLASGAAAYAALRSCALRWDFLAHLSGCPSTEELVIKAETAQLDAGREDLERRIRALERELANKQCVAELPQQNQPLPDDAFENGDAAALYGCWDLGSEYKTRDVDSGKIISYPYWQMCFDAKGMGKQVMKGNDGSTCEGPVTARFEEGKGLIVGEGGNLVCSDGGYIHRRDILCTEAEGGNMSCATLQPETEGEATVPMQRVEQ